MEKLFQSKDLRRWSIVILGILLSTLVLVFWLLGFQELLVYEDVNSTMKFNTALLFLVSFIMYFFFGKKGRHQFVLTVSCLVLFVAGYSFAEVFIELPNILDELFIEDIISTHGHGRMSPATALSFCFISIGVLVSVVYNKQRWLSQFLFGAVFLFSLMGLIAFVLNLASAEKTSFLQTMSAPTSLLFLVLSVGLLLDLEGSGLSKLCSEDNRSTSLFRQLAFAVVLIPVGVGVLGNYLLKVNYWTAGFAIVFIVSVLVVVGFIYLVVLSLRLNSYERNRQKLEVSLKNSYDQMSLFRTALDRSFIITKMNDTGAVIEANDNFCEISGFKKEEILGRELSVLNSGRHPATFFKEMWEVLKDGQVWKGEICNRSKSGDIYWVDATIVPVLNEETGLYEFLSIRYDVSKRKKADEILTSDYHKRLEHKAREMEQFVYIASHDLQEPLNTIQSFANLFLLDYTDRLGEEGVQSIKYMDESAKRMSALIKGLLDYSRIGQNRVLSFENVQSIASDAVLDLQGSILKRNAEIIFDSELPRMNVYGMELRLVFQNLISNSIKFCPEGRNSVVHIGCKAGGEYNTFYVQDNGDGIEEHKRDKVFQIFQQLKSADKEKGFGIGLAHCQKIVEMHGGNIWYTSLQDKGSTFYFTIPTNN